MPRAPASQLGLRVVQGGASDRSADLALARRAAGGDREAASTVYDTHVRRVDATIARILGRRERDHEDLVQTTFVEVVRSLSRFEGESTLATWISRVAAHVALNSLRSRRRARAVFSDDPEKEAAVPAADPTLARRLRAALADLTEEKAEAVVLHDVLGHDLAEVARLTGVTVAAAQSRLVRGRGQLRELLQDDDDGGGR